MHRVDTLSPAHVQGERGEPARIGTFSDWRRAGYSELVPIVPPDALVTGGLKPESRGKSPGVPGPDGVWHGLAGWQTREASEEDIAAWTSAGAGVGLRRGAAFPIDIDVTDPALCELVKKIAFDVLGAAPIRVGRAPKCVLLYRAEGEFRAVQGKLTIAADPKPHVVEMPKQVVVDGVHPGTGKPYTWSERRKLERLAPITQVLLDRFLDELELTIPGAKRTGQTSAVERSPEQLAAAGGKADLIEEIVRALPNDAKHFPNRSDMIDMMTAIKGALSERPETAEDLARDWAERWEGDGFSHEAFDRDWRSLKPRALGAEYVVSKAEEAMPVGPGGTPWLVRYWFDPIVSSEASESENEARHTLRITPFKPRLASAIPPREHLYGHHRTRRFLSATIAPGGLGKSSLTIVEALAMSSGKPLLGIKPPRPLRVWLWNGEDPLEEIERRIMAAMMHFALTEADLGGRLFVDSGRDNQICLVSSEKGAPKVDVALRDSLLSQLRSLDVDCLIIDPFAYSHRVQENDNGAIALVASTWSDIAERANCNVELVHHARKTGGAEVGVEDARGASALVAATRSSRTLVRMTDEEAKQLRVTDARGQYFREGGDPKRNLAPPPLTERTTWFRTVGVALGNGTPEYPRGDEVGVAARFHPSVTPQEVAAANASKERTAVLQAVIRARAETGSSRLSDLVNVISRELELAGVSRAQSPQFVRSLVGRHAEGKGGVTTDLHGRIVRVCARKDGNSQTSPWLIDVVEESADQLASVASEGVLA